jgi:hypothetical protein
MMNFKGLKLGRAEAKPTCAVAEDIYKKQMSICSGLYYFSNTKVSASAPGCFNASRILSVNHLVRTHKIFD